jgi:ABC-type transporter Mla subunit MlaD
MPEDVFRIIVTVGVGVAAVALLVQASVLIGLYKAFRKMQEKVSPIIERADPVMEKIPPILVKVEDSLERVGPVIEKAGPVIEKIGPALEKVGPVVDRVGPIMDEIIPAVRKAGIVIEKAGPAVENAGKILANANQVLAENRPKIAELSDEAVNIVKTGREHVERIGDLLHDASDRAQNRLEQIDRTLENTVGQVEHAGEAMKRAVTGPMRGINGLAAGISAAVATLVNRPKRPSVDEATQDEEMFI